MWSVYVRKTGLEPVRPCERHPLKMVRLPISPLPQREHKHTEHGETGKTQMKSELRQPRSVDTMPATVDVRQLSRHLRQHSQLPVPHRYQYLQTQCVAIEMQHVEQYHYESQLSG